MENRSANPVFRAVSDSTRRSILDVIRNAERSVGEIVALFQVSQPTISQHLDVLARAGLVTRRRHGRRMLYRLRPEGLRDVLDWASMFSQFWPDRLRALDSRLDEIRPT